MFDVTCYPTFFRAPDVIPSVLFIRNCEQYTMESVFGLAKMTLGIMTLSYFPSYVGPNTISNAPADVLSIRQFTHVPIVDLSVTCLIVLCVCVITSSDVALAESLLYPCAKMHCYSDWWEICCALLMIEELLLEVILLKICIIIL